MFNLKNTKYDVQYTSKFKKDFKNVLKQGKDENKFLNLLNKLANGEKLDEKFKNHLLTNSKHYKNCFECHILQMVPIQIYFNYTL